MKTSEARARHGSIAARELELPESHRHLCFAVAMSGERTRPQAHLPSPGVLANREHSSSRPRLADQRLLTAGTLAMALRVALLLSFAVSTHMTTADAEHAGGQNTYERLISARGGRAGNDALLRYAHINGDRNVQGGVRPGSALSADTSGRHLNPHTLHGGDALRGEQASLKSIHAAGWQQGGVGSDTTAHLALAVTSVSLREEVDVTTQGVVALGTDPPEGNLPQTVISGWPIAKPSSTRNRHTQGLQPKVVLLDMFGNRQYQWCTGISACTPVSAPVTASIFNNPGCGKLLGTTTVQTVNGVAVFTDLMMDSPKSLYTLRFSAGLKLSPIATITPPFKVLHGQIYIPDDAFWNFDANADTTCKGCATCSCGAATSYTQLSQIEINAGEVIKSLGAPGASFQPCAGYEFPTVWVRKYMLESQEGGSECDGWVDVPGWTHEIRVNIEDEPGCILLDADTDKSVCRTGVHIHPLTCPLLPSFVDTT